jgi:hypothetical protein
MSIRMLITETGALALERLTVTKKAPSRTGRGSSPPKCPPRRKLIAQFRETEFRVGIIKSVEMPGLANHMKF